MIDEPSIDPARSFMLSRSVFFFFFFYLSWIRLLPDLEAARIALLFVVPPPLSCTSALNVFLFCRGNVLFGPPPPPEKLAFYGIVP